MINKQTTLDLNGPILSFTKNPVGVNSAGVSIGSTGGGTAILSGIATASFITVGVVTNPASNTGYITHRWYEVGVGALEDSTYVTGTATTSLTLTNLITPTDNQRQFYLTADYVPSAYGLPGVAVTVGSARSTANAIIEPVTSETATLTVYPLLEIIAQPSSRTSTRNTNTTFTVDASLTDTYFNSGLSYQWYLNGVAVDDGVITTTTLTTRADITYSSDSTITLPSDSTDIVITVAGGSGGTGGADNGGPGGGGGSGIAGKFTLPDGERTLVLQIGNAGNGGGVGGYGTGGRGGASNVAAGGRGGDAGNWSGAGAGGGGATGVYDSILGYYIIVAGGGGGGGGGSWNRGGGGASGAGGFSASSGPFSISAGSWGPNNGTDGGGAGAGGGGADGGGPGGGGRDNAYGGSGGGGGGSRYDSNSTTYQDQWANGSNGYVNLKFTTATTIEGVTIANTRKTTVSGTKTPTLTVSTDSVGIQTITCAISNSIATNSPILTDVANFALISNAQQYNINVESIGNNSTAIISSVNLSNGDYTITTSSGDPNTGRFSEYYSLYSPDKDINIEMDLYGGKGTNVGSYVGGEGGFARIRFTLLKNTEYVIAGLTDTVNAPFIYRKGQLIACVGSGGNAGTSGNGGFGGGVRNAGQVGSGRNAGGGGVSFAAGTLPSNGIFGSLTSLTAISPDTKASSPNGGRVIPCTRGNYWRNQGYSPCQDIGTSQFRLSDGTLVTNTGSIARGFKAGYSIITTSGAGTNNGGNGGNGATGGNGGAGGSGGGGGSGYTDGSVYIVSSQLGGNTGVSRIVIRTAA
jgi:hypothetical protein